MSRLETARAAFAKLSYGQIYVDDLYEEMASKYEALIRKTLEERNDQPRQIELRNRMFDCLERAYRINEDLMDYGRAKGVIDRILNLSEQFLDGEMWRKWFRVAYQQALRVGDTARLEELFERAVPEIEEESGTEDVGHGTSAPCEETAEKMAAPETKPSEECEQSEEEPFQPLAAEELASVYNEIGAVFRAKGLNEKRERMRERLVAYAREFDLPELEEAAVKKALYRVVVAGVAGGQDVKQVKEKVAANFKNVGPRYLDRMFSGQLIPIKKGVDRATAEKLCNKFRELGAACSIEEMDDSSEVTGG